MQTTGPLTLSVPFVLTVTSLVYQPLAPSVPAVTASAADGPVLSSFTVNGAASALRPALFVHEPLKCDRPSRSSGAGPTVQVTGPLIVSVPLVATVTLLVYQPFAPAVPAVTASTADGPVLSSLTVNGAALELKPALLVQDPLKT